MNINDINRKNALLVLEWCKNKYGRSFYKSEFPKLRIYKRGTIWKGEYDYDSNTIIIYGGSHNSFIDLINTVIHEYIHYTQSVRMYFRYMDKYNKTYHNHPYEAKADEIAKKDCRECLREVFSNKK